MLHSQDLREFQEYEQNEMQIKLNRSVLSSFIVSNNKVNCTPIFTSTKIPKIGHTHRGSILNLTAINLT
jgi:hypothetical protein